MGLSKEFELCALQKSDSVAFGHIMIGCPWVLSVENKTTSNKDRYMWRHNNVLRVLCNAIVRKVQQYNQETQKDTAPGIHFVKEKASARTISSAKAHNKKQTCYEIFLPQMIGQFSLNFQNSSILNKHFPHDFLPNYKTS